jgi:hypothetical protein
MKPCPGSGVRARDVHPDPWGFPVPLGVCQWCCGRVTVADTGCATEHTPPADDAADVDVELDHSTGQAWLIVGDMRVRLRRDTAGSTATRLSRLMESPDWN